MTDPGTFHETTLEALERISERTVERMGELRRAIALFDRVRSQGGGEWEPGENVDLDACAGEVIAAARALLAAEEG